jgi:hypothetical protein
MEADGSAVGIDKGQRADGIVVKMRRHDRVTGKRYVSQEFIPWANVRSLTYGE